MLKQRPSSPSSSSGSPSATPLTRTWTDSALPKRLLLRVAAFHQLPLHPKTRVLHIKAALQEAGIDVYERDAAESLPLAKKHKATPRSEGEVMDEEGEEEHCASVSGTTLLPSYPSEAVSASIATPAASLLNVTEIYTEPLGGYPEDIFQSLDLEHKLSSRKCEICSDICRNVVQVCSQGHLFCRHCIDSLPVESKTCPTCREAITSVTPVPALERETRQCKVKCLNYQRGCPELVTLADMSTHMTMCIAQPVQCTACGSELLRQVVLLHVQSCPHRQVVCPDCQTTMSACDLDDHVQICEDKLVPCPNDCKKSKRISRKELADHVDTECPLTIVSCSNGCTHKVTRQKLSSHVEDHCPLSLVPCVYKDIGCDVLIPKKKVHKHVTEAMADHNLFLLGYVQEMKASISTLIAQEVAAHVKTVEANVLKHLEALPSARQVVFPNWHSEKTKYPVGKYWESEAWVAVGREWALRIYPTGQCQAEDGKVAVFVVPKLTYSEAWSSQWSIKVAFTVSLIDPAVSQTLCTTFRSPVMGQGWSHFVPLSACNANVLEFSVALSLSA